MCGVILLLFLAVKSLKAAWTRGNLTLDTDLYCFPCAHFITASCDILSDSTPKPAFSKISWGVDLVPSLGHRSETWPPTRTLLYGPSVDQCLGNQCFKILFTSACFLCLVKLPCIHTCIQEVVANSNTFVPSFVWIRTDQQYIDPADPLPRVTIVKANCQWTN